MRCTGRVPDRLFAAVGWSCARLPGPALHSLVPYPSLANDSPESFPPCRSVLGSTSGALLALLMPGTAALRLGGGGQRAGGAVAVVAGLAVAAAGILRLSLFPAPE